jgi:hypothetical protein
VVQLIKKEDFGGTDRMELGMFSGFGRDDKME